MLGHFFAMLKINGSNDYLGLQTGVTSETLSSKFCSLRAKTEKN